MTVTEKELKSWLSTLLVSVVTSKDIKKTFKSFSTLQLGELLKQDMVFTSRFGFVQASENSKRRFTAPLTKVLVDLQYFYDRLDIRSFEELATASDQKMHYTSRTWDYKRFKELFIIFIAQEMMKYWNKLPHDYTGIILFKQVKEDVRKAILSMQRMEFEVIETL